MSSLKLISPIENEFKIKICLIGGYENYKNQFQKFISSHNLEYKNKKSIGVNLSKADLIYNSNNFGFYLWNIDCEQRYSFLRTNYYHGAEAIIVFICETKLDQIKSYLEEIKLRLPSITIIFCIILEKKKKEDIIKDNLEKENFKSLIKSNNIKISDNSSPSKILNQICTLYVNKRKIKKESDNFIIEFIPIHSFIQQKNFRDKCNEYYEPPYNVEINKNCRIDPDLVLEYLSELGFNDVTNSSESIEITNEDFGLFSISLKNGKIKLSPQICKKCSKRKCSKYNKDYYICIEQKTRGWTHNNKLGQGELLLLSKILALKSGRLPLSVLKQITKLNTCINQK